MDITMKINLSEYAVVEGGKLNVSATVDKFQADLVTYWDNELKGSQEIGKHMLAIFTDHPGLKANVPYVISETLRRAGVSPDSWGAMEDRAKLFLKGAKDAGILSVAKGPQGGCSRGENFPV